ncbi:hypothetical protein LINPERHAP1_LOCUS19215 [Linum perenne]
MAIVSPTTQILLTRLSPAPSSMFHLIASRTAESTWYISCFAGSRTD